MYFHITHKNIKLLYLVWMELQGAFLYTMSCLYLTKAVLFDFFKNIPFILLENNYAVSKAEGRLVRAVSLMACENRAILTSIMVCPSDSGRSLRKYNAMCEHLCGVGNGNNFPAVRVCKTFAFALSEFLLLSLLSEEWLNTETCHKLFIWD